MKAPLRSSSQPVGESELILRSDGSLYHLGIRPEHVAPKIIIVGDPERVPMISAHFDRLDCAISGREFVIHTGTYAGKSITVVSSGIGVDNIDIVINELDAAVNMDLSTRLPKNEIVPLEIVRIGTSGAMHADIPVGSFVSSQFAFALDGVPHSYSGIFNDSERTIAERLKSKFDWLRDSSGFYVAQCDSGLFQRLAADCISGITATANGFYGPQGRSVRLQSIMQDRIDSYASFEFDGLRITNFEMECAGIYALASMLGHSALTICAILANRATKEFHKNPSASIETLIRTVLERF